MLVQVHFLVVKAFGIQPLFDHAAVGTGVSGENSDVFDHDSSPFCSF
jgi:hypothetical protein